MPRALPSASYFTYADYYGFAPAPVMTCKTVTGINKPCNALNCDEVKECYYEHQCGEGLKPFFDKCGGSTDPTGITQTTQGVTKGASDVGKAAGDALKSTQDSLNKAVGSLASLTTPCTLGKLNLKMPCWFLGLITVLFLVAVIHH